jgi:protein-disulfide isomerase
MSSLGRGAGWSALHTKDHSIGSPDAPITLLEYGDFQCVDCARAHRDILLLRAHLGPGLRFVFRNFPQVELHPHALHAAEAAESVAAYGAPDTYWAMHDALFRHQRDSDDALDDVHLVQYASAVGADGYRVATHLKARTFEAVVRSDVVSGIRRGVVSTPTFFVNDHLFEHDWTDQKALAAALERLARKHQSASRDAHAMSAIRSATSLRWS